MEVQKEAFNGLMEYYKRLPREIKRNEIINECWAEIGKGAENTVSWLIKKHSEI